MKCSCLTKDTKGAESGDAKNGTKQSLERYYNMSDNRVLRKQKDLVDLALGITTGFSAAALAKTANVRGDILHENLSIEQGAFLEGHCRRIEENGKKESSSPINLLVNGGSKSKSEPPPKKPQAEVTA